MLRSKTSFELVLRKSDSICSCNYSLLDLRVVGASETSFFVFLFTIGSRVSNKKYLIANQSFDLMNFIHLTQWFSEILRGVYLRLF